MRLLVEAEAAVATPGPMGRNKASLSFIAGIAELVDLVGLDVRLSILQYLSRSLGDKYRPCPLLEQYVRAGRLGKKVGRGVYDYPAAPGDKE